MYNAVMKKVIINSKTFSLGNPDFRPNPPLCKYDNLSACLIPEYSITGVMTHNRSRGNWNKYRLGQKVMQDNDTNCYF